MTLKGLYFILMTFYLQLMLFLLDLWEEKVKKGNISHQGWGAVMHLRYVFYVFQTTKIVFSQYQNTQC